MTLESRLVAAFEAVARDMSKVIGWLSARGKDIVCSDGSVFVMQGANYPGQGVPNGLDKMPYRSLIVGDVFREGTLDKMKRLGFNTVRLTVCEDSTWPGVSTANAANVSAALNPDLFNGASLISDIEVLDKIIAHCKVLGLRVILDMHNLTGAYDPSIEGKWYSTAHPNDVGATDGIPFEPRSEEQWIAAWEFLAERYKDEPIVCAYDLFNEPHDCTWDDDEYTGWPAAAERCATRIQAINPHALIIVEGVPQDIVVDGVSMSSGWSAGLTLVKSRPVALPVPNKVVYSAHEYASYATYKPEGVLDDLPIYTAATFPDILGRKFRLTWGHLLEDNFAPVLIGEFGAHLKVDPTMTPSYTAAHLAADTEWMNQLVDYHARTGFSWCVWVFGDYYDTGLFDSIIDPLPRPETFMPSQRLMDNSRQVREVPNPANKRGAVLKIADDGFTPFWDVGKPQGDTTQMSPHKGASVAIGANNRSLTFVSGNVQVAKAVNPPLVNSGRYYFEMTFLSGITSSNCAVGLASDADGANVQLGYDGIDDIGMFQNSGRVYTDGAATSTALDFSSQGDVVMVAYDLLTREVWFGVNGVWENDPVTAPGFVVSGTGQLYPAICGDEESQFIISAHELTCGYPTPDGFDYFGANAMEGEFSDAPIDGKAYVRKNGQWVPESKLAIRKTPSSSTDPGSAGEVFFDDDYLYVYVQDNQCKRLALSTW